METLYFTAPKTRFDHELRHFADNLDIAAFKVLSAGIGLGELRPPVKNPKKSAEAQRLRTMIDDAVTLTMKPVPVPTVLPLAAKTKDASVVNKAKSPRLPWERKLFAWGIDLLFVALSLAVALCLAVMLSAVRLGQTDNWLTLPPVQWLANYAPYEILGGVYAAFVGYYLLFKVLAGRTCGESLMRLRADKTKQKTVKA